ncbi:MAG: hypothetical protein H6701_14790 [Myxococcales bacterium]|nr:hypothetical protein [Myxococcales bacterium]
MDCRRRPRPRRKPRRTPRRRPLGGSRRPRPRRRDRPTSPPPPLPGHRHRPLPRRSPRREPAAGPRARDEARAAADARALAEDRAAAEARAAELARWQAEEERFRAEANRPRPITASGDEWARRRAEAEVAARVAAVDRLQRAETAQVTSAGDAFGFNPLATSSSMPRPAIREPRPLPAGAPPPDLDHATGTDEHRFGATSAEWTTSSIDRSPLPAAAPKALPAIGFAGVVAGVGLALLGVKLGGLFIGFGALWAIAGMALIGDRRGAWLFAIAAYLLNALFLIGYGLAGDPPVWIPAAGLIAGGLATALVTAGLLHPVFRDRYRAGRPRF